jgi:hypothetical protein
MRRSTTAGLVTLLSALFALTGLTACGEREKPPTYPDGAIRLRQNVPTPIGERRVFAVNVQGDRAIVIVEPAQGTATKVPVTEGKRFTAAGLTFDVLDVIPPTDDKAEPGAGSGTVMILVVSS